MRTVSVLLLLSACTPSEDTSPGDQYISPLDGQTAVALDATLVVVAEDMSLPPDYPLPDLFRMINMDPDEGPVTGVTRRYDAFVEFTPDEPLKENSTYGWVVDIPDPVAHGPELNFPAILEEHALFQTSPQVQVLGKGTVEEDGRACVVLSRMASTEDDGDWRLTINDETVDGVVASLYPRSDWGPDLAFVAGDPGVDVMCLELPSGDEAPTDPPQFNDGDHIRVWWGDAGPWLVQLEVGPIVDVVQFFRRGVQ